MKRFGTYLFFLTLIVHTFSQAVIVGQYFINKDFIAAELCENKDKPELECDGKCYLKKELKKDEERKSDEKSTKVEVLLFCDFKIIELTSPPEFKIEKSESSVYLRPLLCGTQTDVFHPPC